MGAIFGFSVGWITVPSLIQHFIALTPLKISQVQYISAFGLALVGGLLVYYFWKVAVFASGGLAGLVVGGWTLSLVESGLIEEYISRQGYLACFVVIGGLISLLLEAYIVIGTSIVIGALCMIYGMDKFLRIGFAQHLQHMIDYEKVSLDRLSMNAWYLVGAGMVLAVFGMFYQCQTFRNKK